MNWQNYMIPCLSKSLFGLDCPGCGVQRSLLLVLKGDFLAAFHMFPAIYSTILFFSFLGLHLIDKSHNYHKILTRLAIINAIIMVVAYFYKMFVF
jgi:hypothetical protein